MSKKQQDETIPSFEDGLEKLEAVVSEMEDGNLPLEKLIVHYEEGSKLLIQCETKLKEAEKKIEILKANNATAPQFEAMDTEA